MKKTTLIIFAVAMLAPAAHASKDVSISEECVYLDELTAPNIPHTKVTCGFAPGESKNFPKEVIENYLRRSGIEARVLNDVTVRREGEKLSSDEVADAIRQAYNRDYPDVTVKIEQIRFSKEFYAEKRGDFSVSIDTGKFGANYAEVGNGTKTSQVYVYVKAYKEGYVASERIKAGESLEGRVRRDIIDVTSMRQTLVSDPKGVMASKIIVKGKPVTEENVTQKPALAKGDKVKLVYDDGTIKIETVGTVEENAYVGKTVRVRNEMSQKVVTANYVGGGIALALF